MTTASYTQSDQHADGRPTLQKQSTYNQAKQLVSRDENKHTDGTRAQVGVTHTDTRTQIDNNVAK